MSVELQADEPAAQLGRVQPLQPIEAAPEPTPKDWPTRPGALISVCVDLYHPELVVAFPGHLGTADLVLRARAAGVPVWKPAAPQPSDPVRFSGRPAREG